MFLIMAACVLFVVYTQTSGNTSDKAYIKLDTQNYTETLIQTESTTETSTESTTESVIAEPAATQLYTKVKVTKSGKKYHLPDCRYVTYKTNTTELELEEALKIGYTPCSVCLPE